MVKFNSLLKYLVCVSIFSLAVGANGQLKTYGAIQGNKYKSGKYSVRVQEVKADGSPNGSYKNSYTYEYLKSYREAPGVPLDVLSDNHWTTFSFKATTAVPQVKAEVTMIGGNITAAEFRPSTAVVSSSINGGKLIVKMKPNKRVTVILNNKIKHPLFLFCDPKETNVPSKTGSDVYLVQKGSTSKSSPLKLSDIGNKKVVYFEQGGIHYVGVGFKITNDDSGQRLSGNRIEQVYIPGGTLVVGSIRANKISDFRLNGRGIIAGEEAYPYCNSGDYLKDRIYNSAVCLSDYNGTVDRGQVVDGITSIMPLKYHIQVGAYALVKNIKCFSFHQTTDGIGAEKGAKIYDNFFKVNDDVVKIYNDNMDIQNTMMWHQDNGAGFQFGWNESHGKGSVVKNTILVRDDCYYSYKNESFWGNHSFINWHSSSKWNGSAPVHENHVFDGINKAGMPKVNVWRFLAINMDGSFGHAGSTGGFLKNLQIKNVNLGEEKLNSYVGAEIGPSEADVTFTNVKLDGVCRNAGNVDARGKVTILPASGCVPGSQPATKPSRPTELTAEATSSSSIKLTWSDNSGNETAFKVEQSLDGTSFTQVKRLGANVKSTTISGLNSNTKYYFRVRASNGAGNSTYSNKANATTTDESGPVVGQQLLANPSFENGTNGWSGYGTTIQSVTTPVRHGSKSVKVIHNGKWKGVQKNITSVLRNNGQGSYDISAFIRTQSGSLNAYVVVRVVDADGTRYYSGNTVSANNSWKKSSGSVDISWRNLSNATFYIETSSTGTNNFFVDGCSLKKSEAKSASIVSKPSAETDALVVKLVPNPANQVVNVATKGFEGMVKIYIRNQAGQLVRMTAVDANDSCKMNVSDLPGGIYLVVVKDAVSRKVAKLVLSH